MNIKQILTLGAKGYKAADINELKKLSADNPEVVNLALNGTPLSEINELLSLADSEQSPVSQEPAESEPTPDYKKLYEELKAKNEETEKTIKAIQEDNQRHDYSGEIKSEEEIVTEIVQNFM